MSRLHVLNFVISSINNAHINRKNSVYIKNTSYNINFIKLLYLKNYIKFYSEISSRKILVHLNYSFFKKSSLKLIQLSRPSLALFAKVKFLSFFKKKCQPVFNTLIISTVYGLLFIEEAIKLNVGGMLICYFSQV